jgi:hypothetical protein
MKKEMVSLARDAKAAATVLFVGGLLASGHAAAQWAVIDPAHIKAQIVEFGQQAARWGEQGQQWLKEYQQWKQQYDAMFAQYQAFESAIEMPQGAPMEKVSLNFNVKERCGSKYGDGAPGLIGSITGVNLQGNIQQQRWNNCQAVQVARNLQYNETVDYFETQVQAMNSEIRSIYSLVSSNRMNQTEMQASSERLKQARDETESKKEDYDRRMTAYDTYVSRLEQNQGTLTRTALRGGSGLQSKMKDIVDATALGVALCGTDGSKCKTKD